MTTDTMNIHTARAEAGERYRKAIDELHASFVELYAYDLATGRQQTTFHTDKDAGKMPSDLEHPEFAPRTLSNWRDEAHALNEKLRR